ncbi:SIR2 family protein [Hyphomicrobium sp. DMF-1]|jgi:phosphoserine phosphatase/NAD-dependent SIR2 family protein deacetylase|uniref:SIR2 family protein n=1 Tax=Hyphomicrobium sp. DMF-1 TaxID=3019544 RepID=UPI0022EC1507|nr:SIR2 family protein [Hyphomicrobium sp. DMF-1]WBT38595.1 SIR2 family protein [Hyphomicrobium sp. DMF-1]
MADVLPKEHAAHLAKLLAQDKLILFVGAGISHQAVPRSASSERMPLWAELSRAVANEFLMDSGAYRDNPLDLFDAIILKRGRDKLEETLRKLLNGENYGLSDAHTSLASLPWHLVYTTNYDDLLERALECNDPIDAPDEYERLNDSNRSGSPLIHLHGTTRNFRTLTSSDYANWKDKNQIAYNYLQNHVLEKTILFVGYSYSDPHLSQGLFPWLRDIKRDRHIRHYAWMWRASDEQKLLLDQRDKIEVVSIDTDADWARSFAQLADAISSEARPLKGRSKATMRVARANDQVQINPFKLFYFRTKKNISWSQLAQEVGLRRHNFRKFEQQPTRDSRGRLIFPSIERSALEAIEARLGCVGMLGAGKEDDLMATYTMYYKANHDIAKGEKIKARVEYKELGRQTSAVIFDFGGTLTQSQGLKSTWERIWDSVGYKINDAGVLHADFTAGRITHQNWCDQTCEQLRKRSFSRHHLKQIAENIKTIPGMEQTFEILSNRGIPIYITSGSIRQIIVEKLGISLRYVHEIKANEMHFDEKGIIKMIWGTSFDFEGKARYIGRVCAERRCEPMDVLFVGNNLNDQWAARSGARTLCINPGETNYTDTNIWTYSLKEVRDLQEVLSFI